jgi:sugar phosphate permease
VIFTMLAGAGIGSAASERLGLSPRRRWPGPFIAVIALGLALVLCYPVIARIALALPLAGRVALSGALILPIGFFLGMPFPLGVLAIEGQPRGAVAWAWGMNGLFTVVGSLLSVLLSLEAGFDITILAALGCYAGALAVFRTMRDRVPIAGAAGQLSAPAVPTGVPEAATPIPDSPLDMVDGRRREAR